MPGGLVDDHSNAVPTIANRALTEVGGRPAEFRRAPLSVLKASQPVSRVLDGIRAEPAYVTAIPLGRRLPGASSNLPGRPGLDTDPEAALHLRAGSLRTVPIRSCSRWGLPCRRRCRRRGALLPHRFTLAAPPPSPSPASEGGQGGTTAVCSLWHFPWARARRMLSGTACPRSPDFPLPLAPSQTLARKRGSEGWGCGSGRPAD